MMNPSDPNLVTQGLFFDEFFMQSFKSYHGIYPWYEVPTFDGTDATKAARIILRNRPVEIPAQLGGWLEKPPLLLEDFRIESSIPYGGRCGGVLPKKDRSLYLRSLTL